jgi:effector-binding domain-containing protein
MIVDMEKVKSKISKMNGDALNKYGTTISMSELKRESKIAIYQEIEHRIDYLETFGDAMIVESEIKDMGDFE